MFNYNYNKKAESPFKEEYVVTEMCDVCGKSFLPQYITRVQAVGGISKTFYVIRCCPYCNAYEHAKKL